MNTAKSYDPKQVEADYLERQRRLRRVQLTPPASYWNRYREEQIAQEDAEQKMLEDAMDTAGIVVGIIAAGAFIGALAASHRIFWLPPIIAVGAVIWWVGWGRKKYGDM